MKKIKVLMGVIIMLLSFVMVGMVVKADDCSSKACYCNGSTCGLYRNPPSGYKSADKSKCGCSSSGGGSAAQSTDKEINVCENAGVVKSFQVIGWGLFIIRIVAPLVLIVLAMIDLGKAVISNDDKAIHTGVLTLVKRAIAAVVIFFIPTIIALVFNVVSGSKEAKSNFTCLTNCLNKPNSCAVPSSKLFN